ncbi:MAG: hypothetical protein ABMA64_06225 [Myxococcota bacterium]
MVIVRAEPERVVHALLQVADLAPAPDGPVRMYTAGSWVAVEGLTGEVARSVALVAGEPAAIVEVGPTGTVHEALSRRVGSEWVDEAAEVEDCLDEWTDGERWKVAHFDTPYEADLGVWLLDGADEFVGDPIAFAPVVPLPPRLAGVVARIRAGATWRVAEVEGRLALRAEGADGSRELVFVDADEVDQVRAAVQAPSPPPRATTTPTATWSGSAFTVEEGGAVLISGRVRREVGRYGPLDQAAIWVADCRSRVDPVRTAELVESLVVAPHRAELGAIDAVRVLVGGLTFDSDPPARTEAVDLGELARRFLALAERHGLIRLEPDLEGLDQQVAQLVDRCRRRSAGTDLRNLMTDHAGVAELSDRANPRALQALLVDAATALRGVAPSSVTGWF